MGKKSDLLDYWTLLQALLAMDVFCRLYFGAGREGGGMFLAAGNSRG